MESGKASALDTATADAGELRMALAMPSRAGGLRFSSDQEPFVTRCGDWAVRL